MVIVLDEKLPPPPPYAFSEQFRSAPQPPQPPRTPTTPVTPRSATDPQRIGGGPRALPWATFKDLPSHIILLIVYTTFPNASLSVANGGNLPSTSQRIDPGELIQHRQVLYWLAMSLRLVNRSFYFACMNVLRSVYLPSYRELVRPGYSSDPFPLTGQSTRNPTSPASGLGSGHGAGSGSGADRTRSGSIGRGVRDLPPPPAWDEKPPLQSLQRETSVLDLFIAAKVREDVWLDETELHLEREETFKDLFDLNQPRARLEDLVRHYGTRSGAIYTTPPSPSQGPQTSISFAVLSVSFNPRNVGLLFTSSGGKRTIVSTERGRGERLESVAKRLVWELDKLRAGGRGYGG